MKSGNVEKAGIIYVAFGYEYLLMAAYSAYTARKRNPGIVTSVITNLKINNKDILKDYFDNIFYENLKNELNRFVKTRVIDYAPFIKGAFLDCDTEVLGDLSPVLACLDRFDVILKLTPRPSIKDYRISKEVKGNEFPMWNSGVIFFRNGGPARKLFSDWGKYFLEMGKKSDQPALARTIFENPDIRVLSVNYMWNTFPSDLMLIKQGQKSPCRIWHYRNPHDFPDVAKKIFRQHQTVLKSIDLKDSSIKNEIKKIEQKYRILCSFYYRNRFLRPFYLRYLKTISKLGFGPRPALSRTKHRAGNKYETSG